jgi:hypothetical protein
MKQIETAMTNLVTDFPAVTLATVKTSLRRNI